MKLSVLTALAAGALLAWLLKPLAVLPVQHANNIDFAFSIKPQAGGVVKQRCYKFRGKPAFNFISIFPRRLICIKNLEEAWA